jgi:OFA family oxalate/formate antiporter-like MFS transporter
MLSRPIFYLALAVLVTGALSGLLIAAHASTIGQTMFGLTPATAALFVSLYSLSNASGRFIWGSLSDKIGRQNVVITIFIFVAIMLFLLAQANSVPMFAVGLIGIGLSFGGVMGTFPSITADLFGPKFMGVNYGIMFSGYAIAAFFGPRIGASIAENSGGDFTRAFYIALAICVVGIVLAIWFKFASAKKTTVKTLKKKIA